MKENEIILDDQWQIILQKLLRSPIHQLMFSIYVNPGYGSLGDKEAAEQTRQVVPVLVPHGTIQYQANHVFKEINKKMVEAMENQEFAVNLALNSLCFHNLKIEGFHIPMLDFNFGVVLNSAKKQMELIKEYLVTVQGKNNVEGLLLKTDSSYHAYFTCLLTKEEWQQFLGFLLSGHPKVADSNYRLSPDVKWIGSSLKRGYCPLRWTCFGSQKKAIPFLLVVQKPSA